MSTHVKRNAQTSRDDALFGCKPVFTLCGPSTKVFGPLIDYLSTLLPPETLGGFTTKCSRDDLPVPPECLALGYDERLAKDEDRKVDIGVLRKLARLVGEDVLERDRICDREVDGRR